MGPGLEHYPDAKKRNSRCLAYEGMVRLMIEHGRHFTALSEETLRETISDYRVVIVPEQDFLDEPTKRCLEQFVQAGGQLILTQSDWDSPIDPEMLALAGVEYVDRRGLAYGYLSTSPPLRLEGGFCACRRCRGPRRCTNTCHRCRRSRGAKSLDMALPHRRPPTASRW